MRKCPQGWYDCDEVETAPPGPAHTQQCRGLQCSVGFQIIHAHFVTFEQIPARHAEGLEIACEQVDGASFPRSCHSICWITLAKKLNGKT